MDTCDNSDQLKCIRPPAVGAAPASEMDDPRARFLASANDGPLQRSTFRLESAWSLGSGKSLLYRHIAQPTQQSEQKPERITVEYTKENRAYRYIPQELASAQFANLQHLNLSRNKLKEVAPRVFQFTVLRTLILASNEIMRLESSIEKLSHLEYLSLAGNFIEQLPPELYKLTALTHLDLSSNKLRTMRPGIHSLMKVRMACCYAARFLSLAFSVLSHGSSKCYLWRGMSWPLSLTALRAALASSLST